MPILQYRTITLYLLGRNSLHRGCCRRSRQERRGRRASALDGQPGASSCTAQHMLACRARPAPTACLELTFFSGMVHGPPIFHGSLPSPCVTATLIEDCSLLCASFLAGYAAAGWFRVASHCMRSIWCAGFSLGSPRERPRWCSWR